MPSILDGILPPQQEDQDSITRRLYPWLAPPPTASGPTPAPAMPAPTPPMARPVDVPHGTPAPVPMGPSPQPVSLGPGAATPKPTSPPSQPVTLGSSLDRQAPMPQPPPQAKPGLGAKLTAVALGASGGMPGIEKAIDYYQGVKNKPIADWDKQNAREATSNKAALETRNAESEIDLRSAQAEKDRTPPIQRPENPNQVYADAVQEAVNGGRDPRTDPKVLQIADTITSIQPERAPKAAEKILGHTVEELKGEMAANPALYPGGYMEGAAGFKNTKAAAMALDKAHADADRAPERPQAEDKAISDHLAAQGLGNTPANRDKTRVELASGKANAAAEAKGTEQKAQLRESAQQSFKVMNALYKQDTDPANYGFMMSFIGMMYEGIRGARLNRAELERAIATRSLPDNLMKAYDLYIEKKILTPKQKDEMLAAATAVAGTYGRVQRNKATGEIRILNEEAPAQGSPPANSPAPAQTITVNPNP